MEKIVNIISEYVYAQKEIPDDLMSEFSSEMIQIIEGQCTEEIPDAIWNLENYVKLYWRGSKYVHEECPARIFQLGQLLSYMNMIRQHFERIDEDISLEEYANTYRDKYLFFKSIHDRAGITHKDLAKLVHTSISSMSQFVSKIAGTGFIVTRVMGREKHYYLTDKGETLLDLLEERKTLHGHKYTKLLGALTNLNTVVSNDAFLKVVIGNKNGTLTKNVYATNKSEDNIAHMPILKLSANMKVLEGNNGEVAEWESSAAKIANLL